MPINPYDDLLKNLVRLLEQITSLEQNMRKMQDGSETKPGIIGCAIITGGLSPHEAIDQGKERKSGLSYEMVDAGDTAFLTIQLPKGFGNEPDVLFQERACHIGMNGLSGTIDLQFCIAPETSTFTCNNGVLDVILVKKQDISPGFDDAPAPETEFF
ncbi:MAG: hypothetical protein GXY48_13530 [Methanomicrobiales archaeon]|nr:hypothetical protein [Methanomicrobiales archaeon]